MSRWEYKVVTLDLPITVSREIYKMTVEGILNPLGQEGWCVIHSTSSCFVLRREVVE